MIISGCFSLLFLKKYNNGPVVKALDSNPEVLCSKPLGGSKVNSAFYPSEGDKMSTRNFWKLSGKRWTASSKWLYPWGSWTSSIKRGHKVFFVFTFFIGQLQQFFNKYLFFKFINECQTEILRSAPPSSHVCDCCETKHF